MTPPVINVVVERFSELVPEEVSMSMCSGLMQQIISYRLSIKIGMQGQFTTNILIIQRPYLCLIITTN